MILGFSGTQLGMSAEQQSLLLWFLVELEPDQVHHGDCIGADEQFHRLARSLGIYIVSHPPADSSKRAYCQADEERDPKPYLIRNKDIVNESDAMLFAPKDDHEVLRSGTWSTVRYTRMYEKPYKILWS